MITKNIWIRDTLIRIDILQSLPVERQEAINKLYDEFTKLGYIDARTEIGPDQWARMSEKKRQQIGATACKVFAIESQIKQLMKSDEQLAQEQRAKEAQEKADRIQRLKYDLQYFETYCAKKINSNRQNATKAAYQLAKKELENLV